jgi:hypothetical protein
MGRSTGSAFVNEYWGSWSPDMLWLDVQVADFTGLDGLTASHRFDLVGRANNGQWWVAKSSGTSFGNEFWGSWSTGLTFGWTVARDGNPYTTGTGANFTFVPGLAGSYEVTLTAADKDGVGTAVTRLLTVGSPLMAAGAVGQAFQPDTVSLERLIYPALAPVVEQAIGLWQAAGLDAARVAALRQVPVSIADLPGAQLGLASSNAILVDVNAAGAGWYMPSGSPLSALGFGLSYDLLTAVLHELGHVLGLADRGEAGDSADVMFDLLDPGIRRLPTIADVDALFAGQDWLMD